MRLTKLTGESGGGTAFSLSLFVGFRSPVKHLVDTQSEDSGTI